MCEILSSSGHSNTHVLLWYFLGPSNGLWITSSSRYLSLRWVEGSPVVGLELVELVELQADVLDGELQHVPEAGQILSHGPRVSIGVL